MIIFKKKNIPLFALCRLLIFSFIIFFVHPGSILNSCRFLLLVLSET